MIVQGDLLLKMRQQSWLCDSSQIQGRSSIR